MQAFDTGPGNVLIDLAIRSLTRNKERIDNEGRCAAAGKPNDTLITAWLRHPYFHKAPPKSTALPGVKELVSLRIDQDVLEHFQAGGPGWQDRINDALRKAAGK